MRSASSPIRWIERTLSPIEAASGAKSSPLRDPPRIRCTGSSAYAASARRAAATLVAFESLTYRTPSRSATSSSRCGTPGKLRSARRDVFVGDPGGAGGGGGGRGVLAVVRAAKQRLGRQLVVGRELDAAEPEPAWGHLHPRALEDSQLRVAVCLERAVPVEVIGLQVEQHGDVAGQLVHVLELERRQLADHPFRRADRGQRRADVPGDRDVASGGAKDGAEELGGRRLPVRARHADEARAGSRR